MGGGYGQDQVQGSAWRIDWVVCSPLGGALCRAHGQYPGFAPDTSEVADGFLALLYLVHKLSELLTVIFSPL